MKRKRKAVRKSRTEVWLTTCRADLGTRKALQVTCMSTILILRLTNSGAMTGRNEP